MTRIEEFEDRLIRDGITEEDYSAYEKLLKRVRSNYNRLQHCYVTAGRFPKDRSEQAVGLIEWGLERYPDTWFSEYTAYSSIGYIYEKCGKYRPAYDAYRKAAGVLDEDQKTYRQILSGNLLWMLLHIDGFRYSEQLEAYYHTFSGIDDFTKAFINVEFCLCIAEIVIFTHHELTDEAKRAYENAVRLSNPDTVSRIQDVLTRHKAKDILHNTPECERFLQNLKI